MDGTKQELIRASAQLRRQASSHGPSKRAPGQGSTWDYADGESGLGAGRAVEGALSQWATASARPRTPSLA